MSVMDVKASQNFQVTRSRCPLRNAMTSFWEEACKGKRVTRLDFFNAFCRNPLKRCSLTAWRLVVDSVRLVRDVVVLVRLKWQYFQGYLGSRPGMMESSVKKTVKTPVASRAASMAISQASGQRSLEPVAWFRWFAAPWMRWDSRAAEREDQWKVIVGRQVEYLVRRPMLCQRF